MSEFYARLRAADPETWQAYVEHPFVQALGAQGYTLLQLMQVVGDRQVRIVPDVAVNGNSGGGGLAEGLLGLVLREKSGE